LHDCLLDAVNNQLTTANELSLIDETKVGAENKCRNFYLIIVQKNIFSFKFKQSDKNF